MIGLSTGEQYDDATQMALSAFGLSGAEPQNKQRPITSSDKAFPQSENIEDRRHEHYRTPPTGFMNDLNPGGVMMQRQRWINAADEQAIDANDREGSDPSIIREHNERKKPEINRDHHVPLLASAILDKDNNMVGMAIDHRANIPEEYIPHLWGHEQRENEYMNDLLKIGHTPQDAYHKAHDWSTARESAGVQAQFGEKGLDDYKQHMRDQASIASEPSDRPRHPDAHTTRHGLDESELGMQFAETDKPKEPGRDTPPPPSVWNWLQTEAPPGLLDHLIETGQIKKPDKK